VSIALIHIEITLRCIFAQKRI